MLFFLSHLLWESCMLLPDTCKGIFRSPALTDAQMNIINSQMSSLLPSSALPVSLFTCKCSSYEVETCGRWKAIWVSSEL